MGSLTLTVQYFKEQLESQSECDGDSREAIR